MSLNVKLLRQVKKYILAEPKRLRMDTWLKKGAAGETITVSTPGYCEPNVFTLPNCGTVGCIAGWATLLQDPEKKEQGEWGIESDARRFLQIDPVISPFTIFYVDHWPTKLKDAYYDASDNDQRAKVVGQVIDTYIREYQKKQKVYDES